MSLLVGCGDTEDPGPEQPVDDTLFGPVADLMRNHCANSDCHGGFTGRLNFHIEGGRLASNEDIYDALDGKVAESTGRALVEPKEPEASEIYHRVQGMAEEDPDGHQRFASEDVASIRHWIEAGAPLDAPEDPTP